MQQLFLNSLGKVYGRMLCRLSSGDDVILGLQLRPGPTSSFLVPVYTPNGAQPSMRPALKPGPSVIPTEATSS